MTRTAPPRFTRRRVLRILGLLFAVSAWPSPVFAPKETQASGKGDVRLGKRLLGGHLLAAKVGDRYLALTPDEADRDTLIARLALERFADLVEPTSAEITAERTRLRKEHREDFKAGRVVEINGWILSLTEVRVAALAALP